MQLQYHYDSLPHYVHYPDILKKSCLRLSVVSDKIRVLLTWSLDFFSYMLRHALKGLEQEAFIVSPWWVRLTSTVWVPRLRPLNASLWKPSLHTINQTFRPSCPDLQRKHSYLAWTSVSVRLKYCINLPQDPQPHP